MTEILGYQVTHYPAIYVNTYKKGDGKVKGEGIGMGSK